jgi:hypothetical protein
MGVRRWTGLTAAVLLSAARTSGAQSAGNPPPGEDRQAADAAMHEMSHAGHDMASDPHLHLSAPVPALAADTARARELVATIRSALAIYRSVDTARADGYEQFLPNVPLPVYHFTNRRHGLEAAFGFDPARPTSLLYRKNADGSFTLTGVMYTAPRRLAEETLDARIPRGIARWHQHINWCIPKRGDEARWRETRDGKPVFGPLGPISDEKACDAAGGRFLPHLFGWMVHVNAFESDDPKVIWGDHHDAH